MKKKINNKTNLVLLMTFLFALIYRVDANSEEISQNDPDEDKTEQEHTMSPEQNAALKSEIDRIGEKYKLPKSTMKDLYGDINESDSPSSDDISNSLKQTASNSETKFMENSRLQSVPLKDVEQLRAINDDHKNSNPFSIMTLRIDSYRLTGDQDSVGRQVDMLKSSKSFKDFKTNISSLSNVETIETKQSFPVVLNSLGYAVSPSSFEMINSRSVFDEETKNLNNKPYGYAFYVTSPKDSQAKRLLGAYDNPCTFTDQNAPVCYQNSLLEDISINKDGVLASPYNAESNTRMVLYYQTNEKIIP